MRAETPTLLSLERYAKIMGLDPLHFAGATSSLRPAGSCNSIWMQYDWQDANKVSRDQLARLIAKAEMDLAMHLGYWPAPVWVSAEWQMYPREHRRELYGAGVTRRGDFKEVTLNWGEFMYGGVAATTLIEAADVTRNADIDADGDGFAEWASWTITDADAIADPTSLHAYFKEWTAVDAANDRTDPNSEGADPKWEIHPVTVDVDGLAVNVLIPVWCLFRPQLEEAHNAAGIDADAPASYVDDVVFYRVYNDPTGQVQFLWDVNCPSYPLPGTVCPGSSTFPMPATACTYGLQGGCLLTGDQRNSIVTPQPGQYDGDDAFVATTWAYPREPDSIRFWYRAGRQPRTAARGCDLLDDYWAELIAILATARLERPLCTCSAAQSKVDTWRQDLTYAGEHSYQLGLEALECKLGHRRGEVHVWKHITGRPGLVKGRAVRL